MELSRTRLDLQALLSIPWRPSPFPPHHHHDVKTRLRQLKHAHHDATSSQHTKGHKLTTMGRKHAGRNWRQSRQKGGKHAKDKGQGRTRYTCYFYLFITYTNFCFSQQNPPLLNINYTSIRACFGVWRPLPPFRHVAVLCVFLTKCDRLTFFGVSVTFGRLLSHTSPLPHLPFFRHIADAQKGICNVSLSPHTMNMLVSVCLSRFSVFPPGRHGNTSHLVCFLVWLHSLPIRTPMCPNGHIGGLWQVLHSQTRKNVPYGMFLHVRLHSLHIRTPTYL